MYSEFHPLHETDLNLNKIIPLKLISIPKRKALTSRLSNSCNHLGFLVKDGMNSDQSEMKQRWRCQKCDKRFGTDVNEWNLLEYKYKVQLFLYELFIEGCKQVNLAKRWQIPQNKISRFKKNYVTALFEQHPRLIIDKNKPLRYGLIYGDETFFGKRGNSNQEVIFCNDDFEILATAPVVSNQLQISIHSAFNKIPTVCRSKLRILVSDGEHSYTSVALHCSHRVIHVQQYHSKKKLGQITINKYQKFGPHILHYQIHTHWKIFTKDKYEFGFKWEIQFIQGPIQAKRGGPTIQLKSTPRYIQWVSKRNEYRSSNFQKAGSARIHVNLISKKISLRKGGKVWMKKMLLPLLPIFAYKCITNNRIESKNSQIKRCGESRKQPDAQYSDKIVQLYEFISQNKRLPEFTLEGRPLYKYLMQECNREHFEYRCSDNGKNSAQKILSSYF